MNEINIPSRKPARNKKQVRFWANEEMYLTVKESCEKENEKIQDAFSGFMQWFVGEAKTNSTKSRGHNEKTN